jgi:hypothetical protein
MMLHFELNHTCGQDPWQYVLHQNVTQCGGRKGTSQTRRVTFDRQTNFWERGWIAHADNFYAQVQVDEWSNIQCLEGTCSVACAHDAKLKPKLPSRSRQGSGTRSLRKAMSDIRMDIASGKINCLKSCWRKAYKAMHLTFGGVAGVLRMWTCIDGPRWKEQAFKSLSQTLSSLLSYHKHPLLPQRPFHHNELSYHSSRVNFLMAAKGYSGKKSDNASSQAALQVSI